MKITKTTHSKLANTDFDNLSFGKSFSDHMFTANFKDGEWHNEEIIPYGPIIVNPSTHVFHYGQAIFEGMKAYKNKEGKILLFRPLDNLKRLNTSAERLCMPTIDEDLFMSGLTELLRVDSDWIPNSDEKSLYIRPFMIADSEYIRATPSSSYRFMIITSPTASYYKGETKLKIEEKFARSVEGGTGFAKAAGNYAAAFAPTKHAQNDGYTQVIWTDAKNHEYIEESGTMNIMFRINDTLITPKLSESILGGITRDSVLAIAKQKGIDVEERKISVKEIVEAHKNNTLKEAFGVGTAVTLNPIDKITFRDLDIHIEKQTPNSYGQLLKKELLSIQYGKTEDIFGWTMEL
jgi:branched-chain amino acid aminotransferase